MCKCMFLKYLGITYCLAKQISMFFTLTVSGKDMVIEKLITNLFPITEQEKEKAHKNVASSKRYLI